MIPAPQPPSEDEFAPTEKRTIGNREYTVILSRCSVTTRIDYEGMHDAQCDLRPHSGTWHYIRGDGGPYGDEMWFNRLSG